MNANADLKELAERLHVLEADSAYQRRARILQALWREDQGLPIGEHKNRPLGSRLAMPAAREFLSNYLTDTIREVVRREVLDPVQARGKLYSKPRIFNDLLSSQPLCFNLFGELQADLGAATRVFRRRVPTLRCVTAVRFEWSPGRGDARFTGDRSAFDVFVEYTTDDDAQGFLGIEVKYHENLQGAAAGHKPRYDEVADGMGCFLEERRAELKGQPLQQIWRDHLLAGSMFLPGSGLAYTEGRFVFLYPALNEPCRRAVQEYGGCLSDAGTFEAWTLESLVADLRAEQVGAWVVLFEGRYLNWGRLPPTGG